MAKFYGIIGYSIKKETVPGVWKEEIIEKTYSGDLLDNNRRLQTTENLNDDINISNKISIVADPFANNNFHYMTYVSFMGAEWKITNIEVLYPRLILSVGGVYNGKKA